ncbi:hypothetical protein Tco_0253322, partial [Tanacetum coccineum]
LMKELKQSNGKDQAKAAKKGEISRKDAGDTDGTTMAEGEEDGTEGPMIIEAEMVGHCVHRMYMDGGSSSKILYEHCFNRFRPEVRNQMIPATTALVGFIGEIIWPLGQISLLVKIGDEEHSTFAWMKFHGSKVTLSLQQNYREARGPGSPIHSPRNAKIPSDRRNSHITEQHDYSTKMHNGFRTRGATAHN